jgi:tetratricopeptide (TPR) repeat protein
VAVGELAALLSAIAAILSAFVAAIVGVPKFLELREQRKKRDRTAERKCREAKVLLKKAEDAENIQREQWKSSEPKPRPLDEPARYELEEDARYCLWDALEMGPSRKVRANIHLMLGQLADKCEDPNLAEKEFSDACRLNRRLWEAYEGLGKTCFIQGDTARAQEYLQHARRLLPLSNLRAQERIDRWLHGLVEERDTGKAS